MFVFLGAEQCLNTLKYNRSFSTIAVSDPGYGLLWLLIVGPSHWEKGGGRGLEGEGWGQADAPSR